MVVAGMILGGFIVAKFESYYFTKNYPDMKLGDDEYNELMRKISFIESFISVFIAVIVYYTLKNYFLYGMCLGAFIFSRK
jgi:hypothetical protein